MSQEYFSPRPSSNPADADTDHDAADGEVADTNASNPWGQPEYMTVGSGSQPSHASALMAQLERDSGYGSMPGDSQTQGGEMRAWEDQLLQDRPTPTHTPRLPGQSDSLSETEKKVLASHVHQLQFNQNRVALAKAIGQTVELLKNLQEMNAQWPAHYPSVQRSEADVTRPKLSHTQSNFDSIDIQSESLQKQVMKRPFAPKRAETSVGTQAVAGSSSEPAQQKAPEPRLITPQIQQEFSILKLDLKVGALSQSELVHSLEKKSIASLLDGKISQSVRHLLSLRDRIEDTSSKVLVTGDLNAGKSTFCNALLRRKILPEDQQPCTSIFCEVLDAKENGGFEEVHAVHKDVVYNRNDESTYDAYSLQDLEKIVSDNDRYMQCKVYVRDIRTIDQSLLNNGVVDIALIDAPGLNSDSVKTTAVFARQEEIDVVVFVVSAANHFTLSAKEFIWQAAQEKAYIFMVVNGFDNIRDKERCQRLILKELNGLSPQTFKEAQELVHFVSSNAIPVAPAMPPDGPGGDGGGSGSSGAGGAPGDDDDDKSGKGKGKEKEKIQDFEQLEGALRRFVLEKRARSKLAPAKTYLSNCLDDMNRLATVNRDVAQSELDKATRELEEIEPEYAERSQQRMVVSDQLGKDVDHTATEVYDHTRSTLATTIANVGNEDLGVAYPGLFSAFHFAEELREEMFRQITTSVQNCEDYGRARTISGVNAIKSLGLLHVGDVYDNMSFRADQMFQRKKDVLARTVNTDVEMWDFFDVAALWDKQEKAVGTGLAMTVAGTLGTRAIGGFGWVDGAFGAARVLGSRNLQRLALPATITAVALLVAYILSTIPQTLPPRLARKISADLAALDYTHTNAARISAEVRRVLRYPAQQLTGDLQKNVEDLKQKKDEVTKVKKESEVARKYFSNLVRDSSETRQRVEGIDLEGPLPGAAGAYVS